MWMFCNQLTIPVGTVSPTTVCTIAESINSQHDEFTCSILDMSQGRAPLCASSTIFCLVESGKGLPFTNTPPSWFTPLWPTKTHTHKESKKGFQLLVYWTVFYSTIILKMSLKQKYLSGNDKRRVRINWIATLIKHMQEKRRECSRENSLEEMKTKHLFSHVFLWRIFPLSQYILECNILIWSGYNLFFKTFNAC